MKIAKELDPQGLLHNLLDKIFLKTGKKYVAASNLSIYYMYKKYK